MFTVFEEVSQGKYKKVATDSIRRNGLLSDSIKFKKDGSLAICGQVVIVENHIELVDVPVVTPNCDVIIPSLSLKVDQSSLARLHKLTLFFVDYERHASTHNGTQWMW